MGIISLASGNSCWDGLNYYKNKKIIKLNKINKNVYESVVKGTNAYKVHLDIEHPRKSTCDCPFAKGKRIICKHIVATYFTALPKEAKMFEEEQKRLQEDYEKAQEEEYDRAIKCLNEMSKQELIKELITVFNYGPEWLYNDFVKRNLY